MQQRQLGAWESGFRSAHDMLNGTMLVVSKAHIIGNCQPDKIKHAFKLLFSRHPLLRATIETRGYNSFFVLNALFEDIPLQQINSEMNWETQFELEIHQPLQTEKYLWRVSIIKNRTGFELFLIAHHAIADALSIVSLLDQFMQIYTELLRDNLPNLPPLPFLKNIEQNLKETHDWQEFAKKYHELDQNSIDKIPYEITATINHRTSKSEFFTIEKYELSVLLEKCKQHQVSLNSWLNATILATQAKLNPEYRNASLKTPVNLRQYAEPKITQENIGCFLSIVETIHKDIGSQTDIWSLAQTFQHELYTAIPKIGFLPRSTDYAEVDIALLTQLFGVSSAKRWTVLPNTFGVSNIGRVDIQTDYADFKLIDFVFSTNHLVGNYYMFVSSLTLHDQLRLIFSYVTPLISEDKAKQFINEFMKFKDL